MNATQSNADTLSHGLVSAVRGAVLDVAFAQGSLPAINEALHIALADGRVLVAETQAHLDPTQVRALALGPTAGLRRGTVALATGAPITVPVGDTVLGRLLDVTGTVGDHGADLPDTPRWPIHRAAPPLSAQTGTSDLFMTGIKVIDLLTPLAQGGRRRCSAAPVWANRARHGTDPRHGRGL
jgi:F-type H+-transporting ATPase subunit beta